MYFLLSGGDFVGKKKFAVWVREYGIIQMRFVEDDDYMTALNKMMDVCRRLSSYTGSMHIVKIMEVEKRWKKVILL